MSAETLHLRVMRSVGRLALDVDARLAASGTTALFGPSGAGKTSLLRCVAGLDRPDDGRIALGDDVWFDRAAHRDVPAWRRPVGLMFQDARLFPHLDVAGNLTFAERRAREAAPGPARDDVIDALDLSPLLARDVDSLSGGERQRVALGRTLLSRPRFLLLDEPLASLDRGRKAEILPYLERVGDRFDIATLLVSHDLDEVVRLAERVAVLAEGRLVAEGEVDETLARLDVQAVTGRFEAGTVLEVAVAGHDRSLALTRLDLGDETLVMPLLESVPIGRRIRLRVRARDVAVALERPRSISIRNVVPATVEEIVPEEATPYAEAFLRVAGQRLRARLTRAAIADLGLAPGVRLYALIKSVSFDRRLL